MEQKGRIATKTIAYCALLAAVSIIMARLLSYAQPGGVRWSLDKFPLFLAGMLFGPLAGGLTGFVADFTGMYVCIFCLDTENIFGVFFVGNTDINVMHQF